MRRIGYICACGMVAVLAMLIGCARMSDAGNLAKKRPVIAVSAIGQTHDWVGSVAHYAQIELERVAKKNGWDYQITLANDANEQSEQIIALVEKNVDCIVLLPMDGMSLKTAAMIVQDAGIPLVVFDREIPDFAPTATIKGNNTDIGKKTAELLNQHFPQGTKVLELMGDTSTVPQQRTDGFDEAIDDSFQKEQLGYTAWKTENAAQLFDQWARAHTQAQIDQIGAIYAHDDEIALGVLMVLDQYKTDPTFTKQFTNLKVIISSGGMQAMYQRISVETQYALCTLTYPPSMIISAIQVAQSIILGEHYREMTILETHEVNPENVQAYMDDTSPY